MKYINPSFMNNTLESGDGSAVFKYASTRELDTMLLRHQPSARAGYLHMVYQKGITGNLDAEFLADLARLLMKWSTSKHNFENHARKLMARAESSLRRPVVSEEDTGRRIGAYQDRHSAMVNEVISTMPPPMDSIPEIKG